MANDDVRDLVVTLPHPALPGADWADAYGIRLAVPFTDARSAALAIIAAFPGWTNPLLALRQVLVLPLGLKGAGARHGKADMIGIFPVCTESATQLVAGFDDRHLDFRIVVDLAGHEDGQDVTLTTVIKRHNLAGRLYLQAVLPFHRAIIRGALARVARQTR